MNGVHLTKKTLKRLRKAKSYKAVMKHNSSLRTEKYVNDKEPMNTIIFQKDQYD